MAITTNNLISRHTVGSAGIAEVTFTNIPQTFTDLRIVISSRCDQSGVAPVFGKIHFNGSTSGYTYRRIYGDGSTTASSSGSLAYVSNVTGTGATASVFGSDDIYIPNYTSANYKSYSIDTVVENNDATSHTALYSGLWSNGGAISSIDILPSTGNYSQYTTVSLYGISSNTSTQNTSVPSATGGDVITTDGTYWYHQFLYSGTFTPLKALTADYLVVAGGGGGGGYAGGGGGAGGFRTSTGFSLTAQAYTCTIGAGGAGGNQSGPTPVAGSNSVFSSITSTGGGRGGDAARGAPSVGGSGGGGVYGGSYGTGAAGTSGQGNAGGNGSAGGLEGGGGGGGASAAGTNGVRDVTGGAGGAGTASSYSGSSVTYAGGGGGGSERSGYGGAGGAGGGGAGTSTGAGTAGTANRGGGGGGAGTTTGGNGGSGIVIVRYAV